MRRAGPGRVDRGACDLLRRDRHRRIPAGRVCGTRHRAGDDDLFRDAQGFPDLPEIQPLGAELEHGRAAPHGLSIATAPWGFPLLLRGWERLRHGIPLQSKRLLHQHRRSRQGSRLAGRPRGRLASDQALIPLPKGRRRAARPFCQGRHAHGRRRQGCENVSVFIGFVLRAAHGVIPLPVPHSLASLSTPRTAAVNSGSSRYSTTAPRPGVLTS